MVYSSFVLHVRASEIKLKQIFVSVLFQFSFHVYERPKSPAFSAALVKLTGKKSVISSKLSKECYQKRRLTDVSYTAALILGIGQHGSMLL